MGFVRELAARIPAALMLRLVGLGTRGARQIERLSPRSAALLRRAQQRWSWERDWSMRDFDAPWLNRGISPELSAAIEQGFFTPGQQVLDIGCGQGELVAFLADHGLVAVGVDVALSAVRRARARYPEVPGRREFRQLDICREVPAAPRAAADGSRRFTALVDRGCFHQIPPGDRPLYARNAALASAPGAPFLLFSRTQLHPAPGGGHSDTPEQVRQTVELVLGSYFELERSETTFLDPLRVANADRRLPGVAFWLRRR